MPNVKRNAEKEYLENHIPGALFWNIDEHSDKDSLFPHMLPNSDYWTRMMLSFGIKNTDHIVVYDFSDVHSACRLWFSLKYFGHHKVSVLDGGMKKWLLENKPTTNKVNKILQDKDAEELRKELDKLGIPVAIVNSLDEIHEDPQVKEQESLVETEHPVAGKMRLPRPPFEFLNQNDFPKSHAPILGQHNREVLTELGINEKEITRMEAREKANKEMIEGMMLTDVANTIRD